MTNISPYRRIVPIFSREEITGMALSARNISDEEMQKRFFDMAVDESAIYLWQFDMETNCFIFPQGFLVRLGYDEAVTTILAKKWIVRFIRMI